MRVRAQEVLFSMSDRKPIPPNWIETKSFRGAGNRGVRPDGIRSRHRRTSRIRNRIIFEPGTSTHPAVEFNVLSGVGSRDFCRDSEKITEVDYLVSTRKMVLVLLFSLAGLIAESGEEANV